jgi:hypothetical protein
LYENAPEGVKQFYKQGVKKKVVHYFCYQIRFWHNPTRIEMSNLDRSRKRWIDLIGTGQSGSERDLGGSDQHRVNPGREGSGYCVLRFNWTLISGLLI